MKTAISSRLLRVSEEHMKCVFQQRRFKGGTWTAPFYFLSVLKHKDISIPDPAVELSARPTSSQSKNNSMGACCSCLFTASGHSSSGHLGDGVILCLDLKAQERMHMTKELGQLFMHYTHFYSRFST